MSCGANNSCGQSSIIVWPEPLPGYRDQTWDQAAGQPERTARLDHMPAGLHFGEAFPEPIHFDAEHKRLVYRGMMYHGSYAYLRDQSRDLNYLMAIDQLYQSSAVPRAVSHPGRWVAAISAGVSIAALVSAWKLMH